MQNIYNYYLKFCCLYLDGELPALTLFLVLAIVCTVTTHEKFCFRIDVNTFSRDALGGILNKWGVATIN